MPDEKEVPDDEGLDWFLKLLAACADHNGGPLPIIDQPPVEPEIPIRRDFMPAYLYALASNGVLMAVQLRYA